jgi:hypothetical protein
MFFSFKIAAGKAYWVVLPVLLLADFSHAASLGVNSQAVCSGEAPFISNSTTGPVASSVANCSETFPFSNSAAFASGQASYGSLSGMGSAGDKDLVTTFQTSESFSDALHFYGTAPAGGVAVQYIVQVNGDLTPDSILPFPSQSFTATFTGGVPLVSETQTCTFTCSPFSQTYVVTEEDPNFDPVSFSAALMVSGNSPGGDSSGSASLVLQSISLLDPATGLPLSGLGYSTDSGAVYDIDAVFIPEPGSWECLLLGLTGLVLLGRGRWKALRS